MLLDYLPLFRKRVQPGSGVQRIPDPEGRGAVRARFLLRSDVTGRAEFSPVPIRFVMKATVNGHVDRAFWRRRDEAILSALGVL